ncbi:hypothetical protein BA6E_10725 [Bacteroidales bacterium 6E]|nr:hypothetical protein BA6E_10725 [Bacteroidales bacterium 6E]
MIRAKIFGKNVFINEYVRLIKFVSEFFFRN